MLGQGLMDKEHFLVHLDKAEDGHGVGATVLLVKDVTDCLQERNPVLGVACFFP